MGKAIFFVCLLWATGYEIYRSLDVYRYNGQKNISADEYYRIVHLTSIISTIQILWADIFIHPFTAPNHFPLLPLYLFYVNQWFIKKALKVNSWSNMSKNSKNNVTISLTNIFRLNYYFIYLSIETCHLRGYYPIDYVNAPNTSYIFVSNPYFAQCP